MGVASNVTWRPKVQPGEFILRIVPRRQRTHGVGMRALEFVLETGKDGKRARRRKPPAFRPWKSARRQRQEAARLAGRAAAKARKAAIYAALKEA